MKAFCAQTAALSGQQLIEASAGTGKTWTIASLFVRLVLETEYALEQILVVTYTRAATAELRERLRSRLAQLQLAFRDGYTEDAFIQTCLDKFPHAVQRAKVTQRLLRALSGFDEASIFTIHGFCQRVLTDAAFETSSAFGHEIVPDESALLQLVINDEWRRLTFDDSPQQHLWARWLVAQHQTPEVWRKQVAGLLEKPFIDIPILELPDFSVALRTAQETFAEVVAGWQRDKAAIKALLSEQTVLDKRVYATKKWPMLFNTWDRLRAEVLPLSVDETRLEKFTPTFLLEKTLKTAKASTTLPQHVWFAHIARWQAAMIELTVQFEQRLVALQAHVMRQVRRLMAEEKSRQQQLSYQDLLMQLHRALHGEQSTALLAWLQARYPVALIDEFQDTDPIQYQIFQAMYPLPAVPGQALFLVGDPKQAIYQFRGADIFTYLQAQQKLAAYAVDAVQTLTVNQRATAALLAGLNALFSQHPRPFLTAQIHAPVVTATDRLRSKLVLPDDFHPAALQLQFLPEGGSATQAQAEQWSVHACVAEVVRLLNAAAQGVVYWEHDDKHQSFGGGDIAVVVNTHRQAAVCAEVLQRAGVPCVRQSEGDIFASEAAAGLWTWLQAVHQPNRTDLVLAALSLPVFGFTASQLLAVRGQEQVWEEWLARFFSWQQTWQQDGFMPLLRQWLLVDDYAAKLLAHANGERVLTDWLHLAELMQLASREHLTPGAQLTWLAQQVMTAGSRPTHPLRLESDAARVKIVTIHSSKGLEYGVVFCPYLWQGYRQQGLDGVIHAREPLSFHADDGWHIALTQAEKKDALPQAHVAAFAEHLRVMYVALTRAKARCYAWWGKVERVQGNGLTWLLMRWRGLADAGVSMVDLGCLLEGFKTYEGSLGADDCVSALQRWEADSAGGGHWSACAEPNTMMRYQPLKESLVALGVMPFERPPLRAVWRVGSFSGLTAGQFQELPDHDQVPLFYEPILVASPSVLLDDGDVVDVGVEEQRVPLADFPRGAQAGTCLHAIFEDWEFSADAPDDLQRWVSETLQRYGIDEAFVPAVVGSVLTTLHLPLFAGGDAKVCLAQVPARQRLVELEFTYPVAMLSCERLYACITEVKAQVAPLFLQALRDCHFLPLQGFMKGFMDLVVQVEGKFYLLDYKSNYLGDTFADYQFVHLQQAVAAHHYYLQYWLYSVALHRYLRWRVPGYTYERHFGGVIYLFLRGLRVNGDSGVFCDRPSLALIDALSRLFGE